MSHRGWSLVVGVFVGLCVLEHTPAEAAVVSGVVEAVSPAAGTLTIKVTSTGKSLTYKLAPTGKVTVLGKNGDLTTIEVGQQATVTTVGTSTEATKISVRAAKEAGDTPEPSPKPTAKPKVKPAPAASSGENAATPVALGDWPQYRGPNRDNLSAETGLLKEWPESGPPLVYVAQGLGEGYSEVAVVGDKIFTLGTRGDDEILFALNRENGEPVWSIRTGRKRDDGTGNGPRGTPTVDGDHVYALGANGDLVCARIADGSVVWSDNILQTYQGNNIVWGISESVLIDGNQLICTPGGQAATVVALDKRTGKPIWRSLVQGAPQAGYSSPIVVTVGNVRQYVNFVHTGVVGIRANDGTPLWGQRASANDTANCSAPLATADVVFTASGYGTGAALFRLASRGNQVASDVVYTTKEMKNHHGGMVLLDGYVYGFDEAILTCLDLRTGKPAWQNRSVGKGSVTYADGKLYLRSEEGPVALAEATPEGYRELGRFTPPNRSGRPAWAHPVIAGGRLHIRDQDTLAVFNLKP